MSFAVLWHLTFVPLLLLDFRMGGKVLYCSRASLVFFHLFISEQIKNKASTCRTRLFFITTDEEKKFWKEAGLCSSPCDDLRDLFFAAVQITS